MFDIPIAEVPAEIVMPQEVDRKKRGGSGARRLAIGAIILLGDGSQCVVAGYDARGNVLCHPVPQ